MPEPLPPIYPLLNPTSQKYPKSPASPLPFLPKFYKSIENRNTHEGRVVDQAYYKSNNFERLFTNIRFDCIFKINKPIVLRFILDFYSQVTVQTDEYGYLFISFMIQHEFITLTLAQFRQILKIPYNGQAVFTNEWDLASLEYSQETEGPYSTNFPTPDDIRRLLELERVMVDRTIKSQTVTLTPNQILTKELSTTTGMKQWKSSFERKCSDKDDIGTILAHLLAHMLYCTRPYRHIMKHNLTSTMAFMTLLIESCKSLALKETQRPRSDHGKARHSVSSSSSHHHGMSSHQHDDDDDVKTSRASTLSLPTI
ncbi:hypothetical protein Tco_0690340 [Tanacetum coccineum]